MAQTGLLRPAKHRPGHKPQRNISISLCRSDSVVIQGFVMTERSLRPPRGAGDGGLSAAPPRPLPAGAGFSPALCSPWLLPRRGHGVFRAKELAVATFTGIRGISELSASLPAAVTRAAV